VLQTRQKNKVLEQQSAVPECQREASCHRLWAGRRRRRFFGGMEL